MYGKQKLGKSSSAYCSFTRCFAIGTSKKVPTGKIKAGLFTNGYGILVQNFRKWNECKMKERIRKLFHGFLPTNIEFHFPIPKSGELVSFNLAPGEKLDGNTLSHVYNQKTICLPK